MGIIIPKLLDAILEATAVEAGAKARIAGLRAVLEDEARRRYATEHAAPTWNAPKAGVVRFAPPGDWTAQVQDPAAFGSFVAEHYPTEATAVITIPAASLPDALTALEFAGVTVDDSRIEVRSAWSKPYLDTLVVDVEETPGETPEDEVTRDVTIVDPKGLLPEGLTPTRAAGKLVVSLDRNRRTVVLEESRKAAEEAVADATEGDTPAADPALLDSRRRELEALHGDQLATIAKAHNLGSSGTKAALAERIARAEQATGLVVNPAAAITVHRAEGGTVTPRADVGLPEGPEELVVPAAQGPHGNATTLSLDEALDLAADALEKGRSREVLRAAAKARGLSAAGGKRDVARRLAAAGVTTASLPRLPSSPPADLTDPAKELIA